MTDKQKLLDRAIARLKLTKKGYNKEGGHWKAAMDALSELSRKLTPTTPKVPALGPVSPGGSPLTKLALTHQTSGLPLYPAVDTAFEAGTKIIAPEAGIVTRHSGGESGGYSVYLSGDSGLRYYFTHLNPERATVGRRVAKGGIIGTVGDPRRFPAQRIAHAHVGVNIEKLPGSQAGRQLKYGEKGNGPDYTFGSPSIGKQLAAR